MKLKITKPIIILIIFAVVCFVLYYFIFLSQSGEITEKLRSQKNEERITNQSIIVENWTFAEYGGLGNGEKVAGFQSQSDCSYHGYNWLNKQTNYASFSCSLNCKPDKDWPVDVCEKVCDYNNKNGFLGCRD